MTIRNAILKAIIMGCFLVLFSMASSCSNTSDVIKEQKPPPKKPTNSPTTSPTYPPGVFPVFLNTYATNTCTTLKESSFLLNNVCSQAFVFTSACTGLAGPVNIIPRCVSNDATSSWVLELYTDPLCTLPAPFGNPIGNGLTCNTASLLNIVDFYYEVKCGN